eukprot:scaffold3841_cov412-Prasinococcus_capsulatus_cf.AAC.16
MVAGGAVACPHVAKRSRRSTLRALLQPSLHTLAAQHLPGQLLASQNVQMQPLPRSREQGQLRLARGESAAAARRVSGRSLTQALLVRHELRNVQQVTKQRLVALLRLAQLSEARADLGNHQHVGGRLGADVSKGERSVVLIDHRSRDFLGNDLIESGEWSTAHVQPCPVSPGRGHADQGRTWSARRCHAPRRPPTRPSARLTLLRPAPTRCASGIPLPPLVAGGDRRRRAHRQLSPSAVCNAFGGRRREGAASGCRASERRWSALGGRAALRVADSCRSQPTNSLRCSA